MATPAFFTTPWTFADDLETTLRTILAASEVDIPMPGCQVLDYIESQGILWAVHPEHEVTVRDTKGRLPYGYVWCEKLEVEAKGQGSTGAYVRARLRVTCFMSSSTSIGESMAAAQRFAAAVTSLMDQIALRRYDDVPINADPIVDDWRQFANYEQARVVGSPEFGVVGEDASPLVGRVRLWIELGHECNA